MRTASIESSESEQEPGRCSGGRGGGSDAGQAVGGGRGASVKYEPERRPPHASSTQPRAQRYSTTRWLAISQPPRRTAREESTPLCRELCTATEEMQERARPVAVGACRDSEASTGCGPPVREEESVVSRREPGKQYLTSSREIRMTEGGKARVL